MTSFRFVLEGLKTPDLRLECLPTTQGSSVVLFVCLMDGWMDGYHGLTV